MARKLRSLFKAIAQNVPYSLDYDALKQVAQIADLRTLKHYLSCLQNAGIICSVDRKSLKNLRKPAKLYLGNTCLYFAYAEFEIGDPNKSKEQIRGDRQSFIVKDEPDISHDPQVLPLWIFGFLVG